MRVIRILLQIMRGRPYATGGLIALLLMASLSEGAGIAFMVPLLEMLNSGGDTTPQSPVSRYMAEGFGWVDLPFELWSVMTIGFMLFTFQAVLKYFRETLTAKLSESIAAEMRIHLFKNLLHIDLAYIHRRRGSDFVNSLVTESNRIQVAFLQTLDMVALLMETAVYLAIALILSWQLVLAAMALMGGVAVILKFEVKRAGRYGERLTEINNILQNTVIEHLGGIRILKAFNLEARSYKTFQEQAGEFPRVRFAAAKSRARLGTLYEIGMVAGLLVVVFYSAVVMNMSTPLLLTFILVLYRFYPKIGAMNKDLHQVIFAAPGVENVLAMIAETETPSVQSGSQPMRQLQNEIRFEGVSFAYDDRSPVLNGVSLSIKAGQTTAVMGGSGAGKTTLVNVLMRFYDPTGGRVLVDGTDLKELDLSAWRGAIALVNQDIFLFNDTISNNIAMGRPGATQEEIVAAARHAHADEFIRELPDGYDSTIGDRGVLLSGGQRQRIALARAVVRNPQILILDEATSELDSKSEELIRQAVEELGANRTIFIIAHRLSTIRHADKIIVLEGGRVAEEGTHDSLLRQGQQYAEFLRLQDVVAAKGS